MAKLEYYVIEKVVVEDPPPGTIALATAAVMPCGLCGNVISGMGGPGPNICLPCGDAFLHGLLKGAVVWND